MKLATALTIAALGGFFTPVHAEVIEMYMPNDAGGFLVLTANPCPIDEAKNAYPYAAYETDDLENSIDGCWVRPEGAPDKFEPFIIVRMVEWGSVNIGIFKQKLFSPIKKRLPEYKPDPEQPEATL